MKRLSMLVIGIVLLVSPLHGCASSIEEVARRISFVGEECFIVCDDGTVFMNNIAKEEYPEVEEWKEIISISSSSNSVVGLKKDGTVVATGDNYEGKLNTQEWSKIVQVEAGVWGTFAVRENKTLVYAGKLPENQKENFEKHQWNNLKAIEGNWDLIGIDKDGNIFSTIGDAFSKLTDIKQVALSNAGDEIAFLDENGVATVYSLYGDRFLEKTWTDIQQITYYYSNLILLDFEGKILTSDSFSEFNLKNIVAISGGAAVDREGNLHFTREIETDEEIPVFNLEGYHFD